MFSLPRLILAIVAAVALRSVATAQDYPIPRLFDEGVNQGNYYQLDCIGPAINCTQTSGRASLTIDVESADISNLSASDTQVLFRDGAGISGDADFVYNKTTNQITAAGELKIPRIGLAGTDPNAAIGLNFGDYVSSTVISPLASRLEYTGTSAIVAAFQSTVGHTGSAASPTIIGALVGGFIGTNNLGINQAWGLYADSGFFSGSQTCDAFEFCVNIASQLNAMPVTRIGGTHSPFATIVNIGAYVPAFASPTGMGALVEHGFLLGETMSLTANTRVGYNADVFVAATTVTYFDSTSGEWRLEVNGSERFAATSTGIGFHGVAPVARPAAYTQTYSTASRTMPNLTSASVSLTALKENGSAWCFSQEEDFNELIAAVNALRDDVDNSKKVTNQILDDLQAVGILQ